MSKTMPVGQQASAEVCSWASLLAMVKATNASRRIAVLLIRYFETIIEIQKVLHHLLIQIKHH